MKKGYLEYDHSCFKEIQGGFRGLFIPSNFPRKTDYPLSIAVVEKEPGNWTFETLPDPCQVCKLEPPLEIWYIRDIHEHSGT